jgi:hypothetical protein
LQGLMGEAAVRGGGVRDAVREAVRDAVESLLLLQKPGFVPSGVGWPRGVPRAIQRHQDRAGATHATRRRERQSPTGMRWVGHRFCLLALLWGRCGCARCDRSVRMGQRIACGVLASFGGHIWRVCRRFVSRLNARGCPAVAQKEVDGQHLA